MTKIHPTAIVAKEAEIDESAVIAAYSIIGPEVRIGPDCEIGPHAVIKGPTVLGARNRVYQFTSLGEAPQDLKYKGEPTRLEIGDDNTFREHVTVNRGTVGGGGVTKIGSGNLFMAATHIAHDCLVGSGCVMANFSGLAGHVVLEDWCNIGGMSGIHQFVRIGKGAFLAGSTMCYFDVPPYTRASGNLAVLIGLNIIGLERRGISKESIAALQKAYALIVRAKEPLADAVARARREVPQTPEVREFIEFCACSQRGITREK